MTRTLLLLFLAVLGFTPALRAQTATIQAVHASAALAGFGPIEVYINKDAASTTPDAEVSFLSGTAFLSVPAGQSFTVRARLKNPPPFGLPRETTFAAPALPPGTYVVSLAGIPEQIQSFYAQNPEGLDRALQLIVAALSGSSGRLGGGIPVVVTHAVTDAPSLTVRIRETGQVLATALSFGKAAAPVTVAPGTYTVDVTRAADGAPLLSRSFSVSPNEPSAAFVIAGFLNPSANQNGPPLTVAGVTTTGSPNPGSPVASEDGVSVAALSIGPNPTAGAATVRYVLPESGPRSLTVSDLLGREVAALETGPALVGPHTARLDVAGWAPGAYVVRLTSESGVQTARLTVVR